MTDIQGKQKSNIYCASISDFLIHNCLPSFFLGLGGRQSIFDEDWCSEVSHFAVTSERKVVEGEEKEKGEAGKCWTMSFQGMSLET